MAKGLKFAIIMAVILLIDCAPASQGVRKGQSPQSPNEPEWLNKSIISQGEFILSVGHSQPRETEQEAKDNALSKATEEFVRYCKVDVQSFDRSIEVSFGVNPAVVR